jgi:hypothetical protein
MSARLLLAIFLSSVIVACASKSKKAQLDTEGDQLAESVQASIKENRAPVHHCYEKELKDRPDLKGRVVLEWDIAPTGIVSRIVALESFDKEVSECLIDVIQEIKFKPNAQGNYGRIQYPFEFSP